MKNVLKVFFIFSIFASFVFIIYTIGYISGYLKHSSLVQKIDWVSNCQYKGEKIRNKAECEILYLEKLKSDE